MVTRKYSLTFDIDWAPDFAIEKCLELLSEAKVTATFFATHHSSLNKEITSQGHTLGIHPNFLANSSHGKEVREIIETCLEFAPDASCMRTHALVQSSPLFYEIFSEFPQLNLDVSLFMHRAQHVQKCQWDFDGVRFDRILYNWEDDAEFSMQRYSTDSDIFFGNQTVFDFHPIHVFLNSSDGSEYTALKHSLAGKSLSGISQSSARAFCNQEVGVRTFFGRVLTSQAQSISLDEIS